MSRLDGWMPGKHLGKWWLANSQLNWDAAENMLNMNLGKLVPELRAFWGGLPD